MANGAKGITVTGLEVREFRRIRVAKVAMIPHVGLVKLTGRNRAGKTSLLQSIKAALGGASEVGPAAVNDEGEGGTEVRLKLSNDFTVVRRGFSESAPKGYLQVIGPDGGKHTQGKLDEWLGPLSFDPLAFFDLRPERQREILLSLGSDPELAGKLDAVRVQRAKKYDERTPWISQKRRAAAVKPPAGERPTPVDVSAEMTRLGELQGQERARGDAALRVRDAKAAGTRANEALQAALDLVADIERRLEKARAAVTQRTDEAAAAVSAIEAAEAARLALPDPTEEMAAVRARLSAANETDRALHPWHAYDRAQAELEEAAAAEKALTAEMDALKQRERELIATAGIPVEGLTFGDDGAPQLNGRPLAVASGAEKIAMAVAVALAADPDLRVCLIDEANDIDLEGLEALDALAKQHGFQVWGCRLGLEGDGEVVVVDGEAFDRDAERAEPAPADAAQGSLV